jgi:hypothetical protein
MLWDTIQLQRNAGDDSLLTEPLSEWSLLEAVKAGSGANCANASKIAIKNGTGQYQ